MGYVFAYSIFYFYICEMNADILKKIIGVLAILFVILLTIKFIKLLPAFIKVIALAANIFTIWWASNNLIKANKKENNE